MGFRNFTNQENKKLGLKTKENSTLFCGNSPRVNSGLSSHHLGKNTETHKKSLSGIKATGR